MKRLFGSGRRALVVGSVAAVVVLALFAGVALAAGVTLPFSGDGNTINGCYSNGGALKVLTPAAPTCPGGYTPIAWSQTGPAGTTGATGPKGDTGAIGATGLKGDPGTTGATGLKGDPGTTGATGLKGDPGTTGATGPNGAIGATGANGATGLTGASGANGATGATGPAGPGNLPPLDAFTPTQLVSSAILTCTSTSTSATVASCAGLKLNGLDVRLGVDEVTHICNVVTGAGFISGTGGGDAGNPHFIWTGTSWALSSATDPPTNNLNCNI